MRVRSRVSSMQLDPLAREVELLSHFTARDRLYAYCFCGVP